MKNKVLETLKKWGIEKDFLTEYGVGFLLAVMLNTPVVVVFGLDRDILKVLSASVLVTSIVYLFSKE